MVRASMMFFMKKDVQPIVFIGVLTQFHQAIISLDQGVEKITGGDCWREIAGNLCPYFAVRAETGAI